MAELIAERESKSHITTRLSLEIPRRSAAAGVINNSVPPVIESSMIAAIVKVTFAPDDAVKSTRSPASAPRRLAVSALITIADDVITLETSRPIVRPMRSGGRIVVPIGIANPSPGR